MRAHLAAIMALVPANIPAFDTDVPDIPSQGYVVFFAPDFDEVSLSLGYAPDVDDYFKVMAVGRTLTQARAVQAAVKAALHRSRPVVEGYSTLVKRRSAGDFMTDRSKTPHLSHATDLYHYRATPIR